MSELADENHRSRMVWTNEYLRMLHFSALSEAKAKRADEALTKVFQLLDMQAIQNPAIEEAMEEAQLALASMKRIDIQAIQPSPLVNHPETVAACAWYLDMDTSISPDYSETKNGAVTFKDASAQLIWQGWKMGAKFGHAETVRKYTLKEAEKK